MYKDMWDGGGDEVNSQDGVRGGVRADGDELMGDGSIESVCVPQSEILIFGGNMSYAMICNMRGRIFFPY
jgi:hypothetical protein